MKPEGPHISVVIPTLNRRETLEQVLLSLKQQTFPQEDMEILLCDAGSSDGTQQLVCEMALENLRFLPGADNGRAGARNRGIAEATGRLVLFTDADIIADPGLVEEHARVHSAESNVAVVGREVQVDSLAEYHLAAKHPAAARHHHSRPRKHLPWFFFLTGNASLPRDALVRAGLFDESFQGYGHEDLDLGYRLVRSGIRIRYQPSAVNYHLHPVGFEERCAKMRMSGMATIRMYRKYRDRSIKLRMGVNPIAMLLHRAVREQGWLMRAMRKRTADSRLCRSVVLQYSYLSGCRSALRSPNR